MGDPILPPPTTRFIGPPTPENIQRDFARKLRWAGVITGEQYKAIANMIDAGIEAEQEDARKLFAKMDAERAARPWWRRILA